MSIVHLKNPYLGELKPDFLYHLGFKSTDDLKEKFGHVRVVCMGGTKFRMEQVAKSLQKVLEEPETQLIDLCESSHRFGLYLVGPVICVSHGMGMPSMSILLHEMAKLVYYAECNDPIFIRIGTSGGLGKKVGTVVITEKAYNGYLKNEHVLAIRGQAVHRPAIFPKSICEEIRKCADPKDDFETIIGNTMATDDFYEGQARTDGAIATHGEEEKMQFLRKCRDEFGVRNIEMEAVMFSSFTLHVGIKAADVCVTLVDRLIGDQVTQSTVPHAVLEERPIIIVGRYIKKILNN